MGRVNCAHGWVPSELLMINVLTPCCLALAMIAARLPSEDAGSSQIHIARPLKGLLGGWTTGGGEITVPGADPGEVPPWPLAGPVVGSGMVRVGSCPGSGIVRVGEALEPIASDEGTPTNTNANANVTATIADGRPSADTRRPRAAHRARRSLVI